jgi:hypothetical protein
LPITLPTTKVPTLPGTTGTPKSALSPFPAIVAMTGLLLLVRKRIS